MKKHPYQPLNALEYFLHEILVNLEELNAKTPALPIEKPKRTRKKAEVKADVANTQVDPGEDTQEPSA